MNVLNKYFDVFIPRALQVGAELKTRGGAAQLKWMTQAHIVDLYTDCPPGIETAGVPLHCPNATALAAFSEGVAEGWITWHAFPFNAQLELSQDGSLIGAGVELVHALDARFGVRHKSVLSQRDVPGMPVGALPALVQAGVRAVSFGVNGASAPPALPPAFRWRSQSVPQVEVLGFMHPGGYGGADLSDVLVLGGGLAMAPVWRGDNAGPPGSAQEVLDTFAGLQKLFPNATLVASTFEDFVDAVEAADLPLPVVDGKEVGDTWAYGVASDPYRLAAARALERVRAAAAPGRAPGDARFANFTRFLLKWLEHTDGADVKTALDASHAPQYSLWSNDAFSAGRGAQGYLDLEESWREQRRWQLDYALGALAPDDPLLAEALAALAALRVPAAPPSAKGMARVPAPGAAEFTCAAAAARIGFSAATGAVRSLSTPVSGGTPLARQQWASEQRPLGLPLYETLNASSYAEFMRAYLYIDPAQSEWAGLDFGKGACGSCRHLQRLHARRSLLMPLARSASFPPALPPAQ